MMAKKKFEWTCTGCGKHFEKNTPIGMRLAIRNHTRACLEKTKKAAEKGKVPFHCAEGHISYRGQETIIEIAPGCDVCGLPIKKGGMPLSERGGDIFGDTTLVERNIRREVKALAERKGLLGRYKEAQEVPELCTPYLTQVRSKRVRFPVTLTEADLENVMNCKPCETFKTMGFCDDSCEKYREYLYEKYPVVEMPPDALGKCWIEVMNGMIPKEIVDEYVNQTLDRLRTLRKPMGEYDRKRLLWRVDGLEDTRRALHYAILEAAGFVPLDCSPDAMAFKIVMEHYVEQRCHRLGGF